MKEKIIRFYQFLHKDTWQSWLVSCILIIVFIKLIFFPGLALLTGTPLPLVVVESCSMYHVGQFNDWYAANKEWYSSKQIQEENFSQFPFKNGINKGDIIVVIGDKQPAIGEVIIFTSNTQYPIIHRMIADQPIQTKGDHNPSQLQQETDIKQDQLIGKAVFRIPLLGWVKLIFFDFMKPADQRGLC